MSAATSSISWRSTRGRRPRSWSWRSAGARARGFGLPEETVDHRKRTRVRAAAYGLLDLGTLPDGGRIPRLPLRFDLVVVEPGADGAGEPRIRHHRAAF